MPVIPWMPYIPCKFAKDGDSQDRNGFPPQPCAEFDLDPALVAAWNADPASNFGLKITGEGARAVEVWFASREHPNGTRPLLTVGYDVP